MIQKEDITRLSKEYQISEYVVVREYFQIAILKELYSEKFSKEIYFKGGTAIRLIYKGERFSEDLDFTCNVFENFDEKIISLFKRMRKSYPIEYKEKETTTGRTYLLTAQIDYIKSPIYVRTDFSTRENVLDPTNQTLSTTYPIIVQNFIRTLSKDEILAEKIRAVIKRKKHRDIYDLWVLLELGAKFNGDLISRKLEYYNEQLNKKILLEELNKFNKNEFTKDLSPLVSLKDRNKLPELFDYIEAYLTKALS